MSWEANTWARKVKTGTAARKAVLFAIANDMAHHEDMFGGFHCGYPGQVRIGEGAEMTDRSVRPHLEELESRGLIRRFPRFRSDGKRTSDWLVVPVRADGTFAPTEELRALKDPRETNGRIDHRKMLPVEARGGHHRKLSSGYSLEDPLVTTPSAALQHAEEALTARALVAEWIEHCTRRPPSRVVGQVAKLVGEMLTDDGIDPQTVRRGLAEWHYKGLAPSVLPSFVHQVAQAGASGAEPPKVREVMNTHETWTETFAGAR